MNIISLLGTVPPSTSTGPASIDDLMWLFAALGLSTTAGLRAYLPLLAIGVSYYINPNLLPLQSNFQLLHDPLVLAVLAVLTVVEFVLDKAPVVDHLSDLIHTIIRPASGAIIMAGTHNTLSDISPWLAAAAGGLLALSLHGVKATTRPVVTGTTVGHGNPVVSVFEDVLALGGTVLLLALPLVGFIVITIILLLLLRATRPLRRRLFGSGHRNREGGSGGVVPDAPVSAASPHGTGQPPRGRQRSLGGLIGRAAASGVGSAATGPGAGPGPRAAKAKAKAKAASAYGPIPLPLPGPAPVVGRAAGALGAAAGAVAGAAGLAAGLGAAGAAGAAAGLSAGPAASAPTAPLPGPGATPVPAGAGVGGGTGTGDDTTVQATNQAPYLPVAPNPVQPLGGQGPTPTTTQPYPQPFPTPSQPPWNYPGNAPTLPGKEQP